MSQAQPSSASSSPAGQPVPLSPSEPRGQKAGTVLTMRCFITAGGAGGREGEEVLMSRSFYNQVLSFGINPIIMIFFHMKRNHTSSPLLGIPAEGSILFGRFLISFVFLLRPLRPPAGVGRRPPGRIAGVMSPSSARFPPSSFILSLRGSWAHPPGPALRAWGPLEREATLAMAPDLSGEG